MRVMSSVAVFRLNVAAEPSKCLTAGVHAEGAHPMMTSGEPATDAIKMPSIMFCWVILPHGDAGGRSICPFNLKKI